MDLCAVTLALIGAMLGTGGQHLGFVQLFVLTFNLYYKLVTTVNVAATCPDCNHLPD